MARSKQVTSDHPDGLTSRSSFLTHMHLRGSVQQRIAQSAAEQFHVRCTPRMFALVWLVILCLHAVCAAYFAAACYLYLYIMPLSIGSNLRRYALRLTLKQYTWIAYAHAVFAVPHGYFLVQMLLCSLWHRKPMFQSKTAMRIASPKLSSHIQAKLFTSKWLGKCLGKWLSVASRKVFYWRKWLFGHTGLFGLGGQHFRTIVFVQEATEIVLQTTQAYRMSCWLPRVWLIRQYVALLVFNCWSTTVIQRFTGNNLPLERLLVFVAALVTDIVAIIGVPTVLAFPYFGMYEPARLNFAQVYWYDDVWLINMVNESQIIIVTSVLDIASKVVFSTSLLMTFMVVKSLIKPVSKKPVGIHSTLEQQSTPSIATITTTSTMPLEAVEGITPIESFYSVSLGDLMRATSRAALLTEPTTVAAHASSTTAPVSVLAASRSFAASFKPNAIVPAPVSSRPVPTRGMILAAAHAPTPSTFASPRYFAFQDRLVHWGHRLFLLWGLLVLVTQIHADNLPSPRLCGLQVRPWLQFKPSCSLLEVDCYKLALTGEVHEIKTAMDAMNQPMLAHVVFRHCPNLQMPPNLKLLSRLIGFKIYNSTLTRWEHDAALTNAHHPYLTFMFMVRVNMTELPQGLQTNDYPKRLTDVEYSTTNLTTLPADLHTKWPKGMVFVVERSQFQTVPETLKYMQVAYLGLGENNFSTVPPELFANPSGKTLWLNGNPITHLPENVSFSPSFLRVRMVGTNVSAETLPDWITSKFLVPATRNLNAGSTPLCKTIAALEAPGGNMSALSESLQKAYAKIVCSAVTSDALSYYPAYFENKYNAGVAP